MGKEEDETEAAKADNEATEDDEEEEDVKDGSKRPKSEEDGDGDGEGSPDAKRSKGDEDGGTPKGGSSAHQYPMFQGGYPPMGFPPGPYMGHPMYMGMPPPAMFSAYQNTPLPLPPKSTKRQKHSEEKDEDSKDKGGDSPGASPQMMMPQMMMPYGFPGYMHMYGQTPQRFPQTKPRAAGIVLSMACDSDQLSEYQILVRRQLEIFEATQEDVESNTQGRKKPVVLGQVGLRCRHCASFPLRARGRGAVYYPAKLFGIYQAAQNMAGSHLCQACQQIPPHIKQELRKLRVRRDNASGGKQYWADGCRALGIYEDGSCLRLRKKATEEAADEPSPSLPTPTETDAV